MPAILFEIFQLCIVPLVGILTFYLVNWLTKKSNEITANIDNETARKYIDMLTETVIECVEATTQTYVESLKKQGAFDAEAQKIALETTCENILSILSEEAKEYLAEIYGDLNIAIVNKVEAQVKLQKSIAG
jgi:hypothetical protein